MAIVPEPQNAPPHEGEPADYVADHPAEHPEQWGWHGEWGKYARIGGFVSTIILILMITATHYNEAGTIALLCFAGLVLLALVWNLYRRRTSWRK